MKPARTLAPRQPHPRAAQIAQEFHETYERLAPDFGYRTREESAVPWDEVPSANKALMEAVATELLNLGHVSPDALSPGEGWPPLHTKFAEVIEKLRATA